jgi:hypothetical protein
VRKALASSAISVWGGRRAEMNFGVRKEIPE